VAFVAAHHLGDAAAMRLRQRQQVGAAVEGQRQHAGVGGDQLLARAVRGDLLADDEAAPHRVIHPLGQQRPRRVEGREAHAVGVQRQGLAAVEHHVAGLVQRDGMRAIEQHALALAQVVQQQRDQVDVHRVRLVPAQAEQHGGVAAVALAGGPERAEEIDPHADRVVQQSRMQQPLREQPCRAHRPDRVGAGRPDADLEQIKNADSHDRLRLSPQPVDNVVHKRCGVFASHCHATDFL
jgi:hypothetical protein